MPSSVEVFEIASNFYSFMAATYYFIREMQFLEHFMVK